MNNLKILVLKYLEELASNFGPPKMAHQEWPILNGPPIGPPRIAGQNVCHNLASHNTTRLDVGHKFLLKDAQDKSTQDHNVLLPRRSPQDCQLRTKMAAVQSQNQFDQYLWPTDWTTEDVQIVHKTTQLLQKKFLFVC